MIPIPEALQLTLAQVPPPGPERTERVSLTDALGRVLAQAVTAPDSLPPFPASIKVCAWLSVCMAHQQGRHVGSACGQPCSYEASGF